MPDLAVSVDLDALIKSSYTAITGRVWMPIGEKKALDDFS
ncbi:hypothetical protein IMCC9480_1914 [Oxalobacteraceae bacterium IMCC9480]|nr:hypothetical protein IMCC9480_1914 [Oxalobacteraceae bacterium IMCC9480]